MAGLTLNAMVFKHSQFPNAAKALLQFLMEKEQYDPWLQANLGYWAQPLESLFDKRDLGERPEGRALQGHDEEQLLDRLQGADQPGVRPQPMRTT